MAEDFDRFDDVTGEFEGVFENGRGVMGDALKAHYRVTSQMQRGGLLVEMPCRGCGKPRQMLVEWPELAAIRRGVSPSVAYHNHPQLARFVTSDWRRADPRVRGNYWVPVGLRCRCSAEIAVMFSPEEALAHLVKAQQTGLLSPQDVQYLDQVCVAAAAR